MQAKAAARPSFPLLSLNRGRAQTSTFKGKEALSAIGKQAADGALKLGREGLEGDEQADRVFHGGPDKAVCVYSHVHYPHWEVVLNRPLPLGAFGENFTIGSCSETDVCIGDVFQVGTAVVQISQPRVPCWKLAMKWGLDSLPQLVTQSGTTGFYFRVLETGEVKAGDELILLETHPERVSVAEVNRVLHRDKNDALGIRRLIHLHDVLAANLVETMEKRLIKLEAGE